MSDLRLRRGWTGHRPSTNRSKRAEEEKTWGEGNNKKLFVLIHTYTILAFLVDWIVFLGHNNKRLIHSRLRKVASRIGLLLQAATLFLPKIFTHSAVTPSVLIVPGASNILRVSILTARSVAVFSPIFWVHQPITLLIVSPGHLAPRPEDRQQDERRHDKEKDDGPLLHRCKKEN